MPTPLKRDHSPDTKVDSLLLTVPEEFFFMNYMPDQAEMAAHHHHSLEMVIVVGGSASHCTTFGESPCRAGQIYLIPPGVWHAYAGCRDLQLYNCHFPQPLLGGPLAWAAEDPSLGLLLKPDPWHGALQVLKWELPLSMLPEAQKLLSMLLETYEDVANARRGRLVGQLLLLLDFLAHRGHPTYTPVADGEIHSGVRRAVSQLRANLAREWTLPELAHELRINPSYLVRIFRDATGFAPMKFLARERAQKAAQLLLTSELPVSEIGARVGWDEPKQFARSFRQHFGESATEFRRRLIPETARSLKKPRGCL